MTPKPQNIFPSTGQGTPEAHRFSHEAMATVFELFIQNEDRSYAQQAAQAAFEEVDRLELELSRFIENSDISRLNNARPGTPVSLGLETFACLQHSTTAFRQTGGAFDITIGALYACWLDQEKNLRQPSPAELERARNLTGLHHLRLDPDELTAQVDTAGVQFDLGGIGKGYAADKLAELLLEWSLDRALILAGASSILAMKAPDGFPGWPLTLRNPKNRDQILARIQLVNQAVSGSGLEQGRHIIDPRPNRQRPIEGKLATWSLAPDAVTADALSTAFMVLTPDEVEQLCAAHSGIAALLLLPQPPDTDTPPLAHRYGPWP